MVLPEYIQIVGLGLDLAFSVAFLFFVVRFGSYWLGGIMLVQAGQFTLHAYYLVLERPQDRLHAIFNNVGVLMSVGLLVFGTYLHRRTDRLATD